MCSSRTVKHVLRAPSFLKETLLVSCLIAIQLRDVLHNRRKAHLPAFTARISGHVPIDIGASKLLCLGRIATKTNQQTKVEIYKKRETKTLRVLKVRISFHNVTSYNFFQLHFDMTLVCSVDLGLHGEDSCTPLGQRSWSTLRVQHLYDESLRPKGWVF